MSSTGYTHDEGFEVYESAMAAPYFAYARMALGKLLRKHAIAPGRSLDLACGGGRLVQHLAQQGWDAHGCDLSGDAISTAQRTYPELKSHFFVADMADAGGERSYDLITVVFNSIHYLPADRRSRMWAALERSLAPGGWFISQQNTFAALRSYWLGHTHRWESEHGFAFWTGVPATEPGTVQVDKTYFTRTADGGYALSRVRHPYHLFETAEMTDALRARGIETLDQLDGKTLGKTHPRSDSVWVVARKAV